MIHHQRLNDKRGDKSARNVQEPCTGVDWNMFLLYEGLWRRPRGYVFLWRSVMEGTAVCFFFYEGLWWRGPRCVSSFMKVSDGDGEFESRFWGDRSTRWQDVRLFRSGKNEFSSLQGLRLRPWWQDGNAVGCLYWLEGFVTSAQWYVVYCLLTWEHREPMKPCTSSRLTN